MHAPSYAHSCALASATNPSLDSWDQAPIATHRERRLIDALTARAGYDPARADGVVTNGGTQSNLMGLLLARDGAERRRGRDAAADGSVVFRYLPARDHPARSDRLNDAIRLRLLAAGEAVIRRTEVAGRTHLKLTLLNPDTAETDLAKLVASVVRTGAELDRD